MKITVSAPGKLMIMGEHAVVYDRPCIVTAAGKRFTAQIEEMDDKTFCLEASDIGISGYKKPMSRMGKGEIPKNVVFAETAISNFQKIQPIKTGLKITTRSDISSYGFGCSSAVVVCTIFGLSEMLGLRLGKKEIFDLAYKTVLDVQGKGSGFDIAAAVFGGTLYFVTGGKVIEPLTVESLPLVIGYSGVKAETVTLINQVKEKAEKYPEVIESVYSLIGELVDSGREALIHKDWHQLGDLMNFNQGLLAALGVSTKKLADMVYASREAGAYGVKLSGAGGGDCMIALVSEEKKNVVRQALYDQGAEVINVDCSAKGVRVET